MATIRGIFAPVIKSLALAGQNVTNKYFNEWANSLYRESQFEPILTFGGNPGGTYTATGNYVRIGNVIYFNLLVQMTNLSGGTGSIGITGFPMSWNSHVSLCTTEITGWAAATYRRSYGRIVPQTSVPVNGMYPVEVHFYADDANGYPNLIGHSDVVNSCDFQATGFYRISPI